MPSRSRRLAACLALVVGAGALSSIAPVAAAPDDQAFAPLRGFEPTGAKVRVEPKEYAATRVDLGALRGSCPGGRLRGRRGPRPDGRLQSFRVERTQTMESELAAAHPEIADLGGRRRRRPAGLHRPRHHPDGLPRLRPGAGRPATGTSTRPTTGAAPLRTSATAPPTCRQPSSVAAEGEVEALRETVTAASRPPTTPGSRCSAATTAWR